MDKRRDIAPAVDNDHGRAVMPLRCGIGGATEDRLHRGRGGFAISGRDARLAVATDTGLFLEGGGVYRLDADWHPVTAGDAIWIAAYCPQWFIAAGPGPARYIYYKDVNRLPA